MPLLKVPSLRQTMAAGSQPGRADEGAAAASRKVDCVFCGLLEAHAWVAWICFRLFADKACPLVLSLVIVDLQEVVVSTKENPRIIHATELMNLVSAMPSSLGAS